MNEIKTQPHLQQLFQKYMEFYVVENQHLIDVLFLSFCGIVLQYKFLYSSQYIKPRVCSFNIQDSGSGKSQAMSGFFWLLREILPATKVFKCTKTSDAGLIGSPDHNKEREDKQSRLLFNKEALIWDEGSTLLKVSPYSENLQDIIQMATDEPGWIAKALKDGEIQGRTETTIVAGSYFEENIKYQLLRRGFFQRMFLTYKEFTKKEKLLVQSKLENLERVSYIDKVNLQREIKKCLATEYKFYYPKEIDRYAEIKIPLETSNELSALLKTIFEEKILEQYLFDDKRQKVLETTWNRARLLILKISIQRAALNKRENVAVEDVEYAIDLVMKYHIHGMKSLLDALSDEKQEYKPIDEKSQKELLLKYIAMAKKECGENLNQSQFITFVKKMKRKQIDEKLKIGFNRSLKLLSEAEAEGKIKIKKINGEKIIDLATS